MTPHKIAPKLGQVSYPTDGSAVPSPFTNNKNSTPTPREVGDERARGFLGFVVLPRPFVGEPARIRDYMSQEAVQKEGGVWGGRGRGLTIAVWEA